MFDFAQELASRIPRLRRYARALTHDAAWADDLVQDTLERALRRRWLFRINSNLTAWLFTILHRDYLNDASRHRMAQEVPEGDAPDAVAPGDPTLHIDLRRALGRLSVEHRTVILLVGLEQLSYKEAAEVLNLPLGTVMSRLARARDQLQFLMSGAPAGDAKTAALPAHLTRIK